MAVPSNDRRIAWLNRAETLFGELSARRPGACSIALGLIVSAGFPPLHAWWLALPALALFAAHLHKAPNARAALWRGWVFGWAHLTLANNWIATAFTHQAKMPELLGWAAVPLLCVYLAIYPALAALIAHITAKGRGRLAFAFILAAVWIITEWIRSWAFTGYPWPPLGLMLLGGWDTPGIALILPWIGTYALSGVAVLIAAFIWVAWSSERRVLGALVLAPVTAAMLAPSLVEAQDTEIRYTLVQPLITQDEINDASKFEDQFSRITELTEPGRNRSRVVLWPESAIPDYLEDGYPQRYYRAMTAGADPEFARGRIGALIGPQSTLLTGVVNLDIGVREDGTTGAVSARNSVIAIDGAGDITKHYAKAHLVPYGEYLPLEEWLGVLGLARLSAGTIPYVAGPGPQSLDLGVHGNAGIQICYEIVFSGQVVDRENRPDYLFNPSNDGWFGTWGPPQHLAQARMRAIEEGLPVLRSTTTGISAVIDANGIVRQTVGTNELGMVEGFVPVAKDPTLFATYGNAVPLVWATLMALVGFGLSRLLALRSDRS